MTEGIMDGVAAFILYSDASYLDRDHIVGAFKSLKAAERAKKMGYPYGYIAAESYQDERVMKVNFSEDDEDLHLFRCSYVKDKNLNICDLVVCDMFDMNEYLAHGATPFESARLTKKVMVKFIWAISSDEAQNKLIINNYLGVMDE